MNFFNSEFKKFQVTTKVILMDFEGLPNPSAESPKIGDVSSLKSSKRKSKKNSLLQLRLVADTKQILEYLSNYIFELPQDLQTSAKNKKEHHVTICYSKNDDEKKAFKDAFSPFLEKEVTVTLLSLVYDNMGAAMSVDLPEEVKCQSEHPHITIACAQGVLPVYSNKLLSKPAHEVTTISFVEGKQLTLTGKMMGF